MFSFLTKVYAQSSPVGGIVKCGPKALGYTEECGKEQFWQIVHDLINYGIYLGIIAVGLSVILAGGMLLISRGSGEKVSAGKRALKASITGLIITLTAWLIVNTIISALLPGCEHWNIFGEFKCN